MIFQKIFNLKKVNINFLRIHLKKKLNGKATHKISNSELDKFIDLIKKSSKPIFYTGGGVINSGPEASKYLRELVSLTGFPITSTLQGLGAYPGDDPQFLGMLGMHGTYEANNAMHDCDLMINIGARFDDRITGKIDEFSPKSKKIHVDIDPSSIGKNVQVDLAITSDVTQLLQAVIKRFKEKNKNFISSNKQKKIWQKNFENIQIHHFVGKEYKSEREVDYVLQNQNNYLETTLNMMSYYFEKKVKNLLLSVTIKEESIQIK